KGHAPWALPPADAGRRGKGAALPERAVPAAVAEVDDKPDGHPDHETQPRLARQARHQRQTDESRQGRDEWDKRRPEGPLEVRPPVPQDDHANRDDDEGEERA